MINPAAILDAENGLSSSITMWDIPAASSWRLRKVPQIPCPMISVSTCCDMMPLFEVCNTIKVNVNNPPKMSRQMMGFRPGRPGRLTNRLAQIGFRRVYKSINQYGIKKGVDEMGIDAFIEHCARLAAGEIVPPLPLAGGE